MTLLYGRLKDTIGSRTYAANEAGGATDIAAAKSSRVEILGGEGAIATASASLAVESGRGRLRIDVQEGQSLDTVARQINRHSIASGVVASVSGNNLLLSSVDVGRDAELRVGTLSTGRASVVRGVNSAQISLFRLLSPPRDRSESLEGTLISSAQSATLRYVGAAGGLVAADARFLLRGAGGTTTVDITQGQSLAAVAQQINAESASTGVRALVDGEDLLLESTTIGADAIVRVELVDATFQVTTTGINASQVASFTAAHVEPGEHLLVGSVLRAGAHAELTLRGGAGGVVVDGATFELRGADGAATIAITAGESLADVAGRINALSATTGVEAALFGNDLVFRSVDVGSAASVEVKLLSVDYDVTASGVNAQQVASFTVQNISTGATDTVTGSITQEAGRAELTFRGGILGVVGRNATFTLTGNSGSGSFSVTRLETLQSLADRVNAVTATTGVQAMVQGNDILFQSTSVGSASFVKIKTNSGQFPVAGGDGNGLANGADAIAVINGQTITGSGNDFTYASAVGSYSFTAAQGFSGALSPITIQSQRGQFDVVGGNGNGTAAGLDVLVEVNGEQWTGAGNHVTIHDFGGQYDFELQAGFTGALDPITIRSEAIGFEILGGNGAGRAAGADAVALINGVRHIGSREGFTVHGLEGSYLLQFAEGFTGDFDPITVATHAENLQLRGGHFGSPVRGVDAEVTFHGDQLIINRSSGSVSTAADFAIAHAASRQLYQLAEADPGALAAILSPDSRAALPQRQLVAGLLL